jgi:hypothetical protein
MFSALLDTCVLVPSRARDVLLEIASTGAYRPLWSTEILAELDRTLRLLLGKRGASPEETDAYLARLFRQMETTFPDALVTGWEPLAATVMLPDPDDRHVVAAAWRAALTCLSPTTSRTSRPPPCPYRWPGNPWTISCSTHSTSIPSRQSPQSAPSPAGQESQDPP